MIYIKNSSRQDFQKNTETQLDYEKTKAPLFDEWIKYRETNKNFKMRKTVLVTGGAGYIGSHTTVELLETGQNLISFLILCLKILILMRRWLWRCGYW